MAQLRRDGNKNPLGSRSPYRSPGFPHVPSACTSFSPSLVPMGAATRRVCLTFCLLFFSSFFSSFLVPFFIWYLLISGRGALAREGLGKFSWSAPVAEDCVAAPRLVGKVV